jgi:hypothetical protein
VNSRPFVAPGAGGLKDTAEMRDADG